MTIARTPGQVGDLGIARVGTVGAARPVRQSRGAGIGGFSGPAPEPVAAGQVWGEPGRPVSWGDDGASGIGGIPGMTAASTACGSRLPLAEREFRASGP